MAIERIEQTDVGIAPRFPDTRYMGSKQKLVAFILEVAGITQYRSVLDAFSGSGVVSHAFKVAGKHVIANDFLEFAHIAAKSMVENSSVQLLPHEVDDLLRLHPRPRRFISENFAGLYYSADEDAWLDNVLTNVRELDDEYRRAIALTALCRAALRKRPRGVFTYVGTRYQDGRRDLRLSFEEQFRRAVAEVNAAVFENGTRSEAVCGDIFELSDPSCDLVYLDPPYVSAYSDNEYLRRYHFLEGLVSHWTRAEIQPETKTKKLKKRPSRFDGRRGIEDAFRALFARFPNSALLLSYSSNGIPDQESLRRLLSEVRAEVTIFERPHMYSFSSHQSNNEQNRVRELLFLAV